MLVIVTYKWAVFWHAGNHAAALSLAARTRGVPAHIVMPSISTPTKIAATRSYGARIVFSGSTSQEREAALAGVLAETGARFVPPYDHPDIILGQGTMALEMEEQVREAANDDEELGEKKKREPLRLDAVLAPCGGGGMLSGIATALAGTGTRVYGAEPSFEGADDCRRGLAEDPPRRVETVRSLTVADGLRTPVGELPWTVISDADKVAGVYGVGDAPIVRALRLVLERMKVVVEPSAVVGLAVALWDEGFRREVERLGGEGGWDVGVVFSGGNLSVDAMGGLFGGENGKGEGGEGTAVEERQMGVLGLDGKRVAENVAG